MIKFMGNLWVIHVAPQASYTFNTNLPRIYHEFIHKFYSTVIDLIMSSSRDFRKYPYQFLYLRNLEVYHIFLFIILCIKERDAEVVQIEADDGGQALPPIRIPVYVGKQKHGTGR